MTREEVFAKLNEVFRDVFDDEDIVVTDDTQAIIRTSTGLQLDAVTR